MTLRKNLRCWGRHRPGRRRHSMLTARIILLFTASISASVLAQDPQQASNPTFQTKVNLVLVPVVVRDAAGRPIGNLTRDDFQIFDKGKLQTISSFSVLEHTNNATINQSVGAARPQGSGTELAGAKTRPAEAVNTNIRPERYIVYVFDDLNTTFTYVTYAREAVLQY